MFNAGAVIVTVGLVLVVFCVAQLFNPYLRRVEDKDYIEAVAARAAAG